jgi:Rieske Fe-S protein
MTEGTLEERLHRYGDVMQDRLRVVPLDAPFIRRPHPSRRRVGLTVAAVAVACALVVAVPVLARSGESADTHAIRSGAPGVHVRPLDTVPEGVSLVDVDGQPVFLAREGKEVTAFIADVRHLAGEPLWWCPADRVFVAPTHGEHFDAAGRRIAGPSRGDLNRFPTRIEGSDLLIDPTQVIVGPSPDDTGASAGTFDGRWGTTPETYCVGALRSDD